MREWLQRNQGLATVIAVVILVIALAMVFMGGGGSAIGGTYYYDLNTNELFTSKEGKVPPFETASGSTAEGEPAGVEAVVYACSEEECGEVTVENIGYLTKYTPKGLELVEQLNSLPLDDRETRQQLAQQIEFNRVARLPGESEWVSTMHPKILGILRTLQNGPCRGRVPVRCQPQ